jgi:hypothetical protein
VNLVAKDLEVGDRAIGQLPSPNSVFTVVGPPSPTFVYIRFDDGFETAIFKDARVERAPDRVLIMSEEVDS